MKVVIERFIRNNKQTLGNMFIDGRLVAKTLELPWLNNARRISCIPTGEYQVVKRISQKYRNHFHILNVPARDWILIHHGNFNKDTLGCILVGRTHTDINRDTLIDVTNSLATMAELTALLPNSFTLEIKEV